MVRDEGIVNPKAEAEVVVEMSQPMRKVKRMSPSTDAIVMGSERKVRSNE